MDSEKCNVKNTQSIYMCGKYSGELKPVFYVLTNTIICKSLEKKYI